jgi:hypothetical protein
LAALIPTRRALNPPGPRATAIPDRSRGVSPLLARSSDTAGINWVVWLVVEYQERQESTRSSSDRATPAYLVEVSMDRSI